MTATPDLAGRYLAAWNETDPAARGTALAALFADDVRYTDPLVTAEGRAALDATIGAVQQQFPGFTFRLAGPVDAHHDHPASRGSSARTARRHRSRGSTSPSWTATGGSGRCWASSTACRRGSEPGQASTRHSPTGAYELSMSSWRAPSSSGTCVMLPPQ
ncbi:MAG TPA: nuclear transport factor 2 family protein [Blastococcus sp.]|nr:nuclear transport factor 2 family protein [Blastococcus sp.]